MFSAKLYAMKVGVEMVEVMRYKLRMLGIPLDGSAKVFFDNEELYKNTVKPESTLIKKNHSISYNQCRESVAAKVIIIAQHETGKNMFDLFTNFLTIERIRFLLYRFTY